MNESRRKVINFLSSHGLDVESYKKDAFLPDFISECEKGLAGEESSLRMLPSFIEGGHLPMGFVLVIDLGGTNLRVHLLRREELVFSKRYSMLGVHQEITKEHFFDQLAEYIFPLVEHVEEIKCCFSYPAEIQEDGDAKILSLAKEVKIKGIEGSLLGEELNKSLLKKGVKDKKKIIILNDTTATLLSGYHSYKRYSSYIGVVLGTGFNVAYIEQTNNIGKLKGKFDSQEMIINTEAGCYSRNIIKSTFDKILEEKTLAKEYMWEKMISGAYLGELSTIALRIGAEENFFSKESSKILKDISHINTKALNEYIIDYQKSEIYLNNRIRNESDLEKIYFVFHIMIERSVWLLALAVASIMIKSNGGRSPLAPLCISIDGSTINNVKNYKNKFYLSLKEILKNKGIFFYFNQVEDATIRGSILAKSIL